MRRRLGEAHDEPADALAERIEAATGPQDAAVQDGEVVGHALDMVRSHNFAPGNAGTIFWTDLLLPAVGLALVAASRHRPEPTTACG